MENVYKDSYISRKGGEQHQFNYPLGQRGSYQRLPPGYVQEALGYASGIAPITRNSRFKGYFADGESARGGSSVKTNVGEVALKPDTKTYGRTPYAVALDNISERGAKVGTQTMAIRTRRNASRYLAPSREAENRRLLGEQVAAPMPGIVVPTLPNPTGNEVFHNSWRGWSKVVTAPYFSR